MDAGEVVAAARRLIGVTRRTPVLRSPELDRAAGARIWLKAEYLQLTGSYKARGAFHAVGRLAEVGDCRRVLATSTGNHGIAVAAAAQRYGIPAVVVLPSDAPAVKVEAVRRFGATAVAAGTSAADRAAAIQALRHPGDVVLDAYDHPDVIAGQGTATAELVADVAALGGRLDAVVLPVGGGGGLAGAALALRGSRIALHGVEPAGCDSLRRSLQLGRVVPVGPAPTLADGLRPPSVGALPFALLRDTDVRVTVVDDDEIAAALVTLLLDAKLAVEPSAAAALAGALSITRRGGPADLGVVLTGGNVDAAVLARLLAEHALTADLVEVPA
jgi:threonine dehydratase